MGRQGRQELQMASEKVCPQSKQRQGDIWAEGHGVNPPVATTGLLSSTGPKMILFPLDSQQIACHSLGISDLLVG